MLFFVSKTYDISDICNFADDNTLSSCGKMLGDILHNLKFDLGYILKWFYVNSIKRNSGKFQGSLQIRHMLIIVTQLDKESTAQLLGVSKQLSFRYLIDSLFLLGSFVNWYLSVYLTRSKPTVSKVLVILLVSYNIKISLSPVSQSKCFSDPSSVYHKISPSPVMQSILFKFNSNISKNQSESCKVVHVFFEFKSNIS